MELSYSQRLDKLIKTIKEENISYGLLHLVSGLSKTKIVAFTNKNLKQPNPARLKILEDSVHKILNSNNVYDKYIRGDVVEYDHDRASKHIIELRQFLDDNNLKICEAARICGLTLHNFNSAINLSTRNKLSEDRKNQVIKQINEHLHKND